MQKSFWTKFQTACALVAEERYGNAISMLVASVTHLDREDHPQFLLVSILKCKWTLQREDALLDDYRLAATNVQGALSRLRDIYGTSHPAIIPTAKLAAMVHESIANQYALEAAVIEAERLCPPGFDEDLEGPDPLTMRKAIEERMVNGKPRKVVHEMPASAAGRMAQVMENRRKKRGE